MESHLACRLVTQLGERDILELHRLFQSAWWTKGRSLPDIRRMLENSNCVFGLRSDSDDRLVAFARVLTDKVFKAIIFDVIVTPELRGEGLGRQLMENITNYPGLKDLRHFELYCLPDLVPFYGKWGFTTEVSGVVLMRREHQKKAS